MFSHGHFILGEDLVGCLTGLHRDFQILHRRYRSPGDMLAQALPGLCVEQMHVTVLGTHIDGVARLPAATVRRADR